MNEHIQIFRDIEQGTPEWFKVRACIPTASCFADILAKGRGNEPSKTRRAYMLKLIGEKLTGEVEEEFSSVHMERGKIMEEAARAMYTYDTGNELERVAFIKNTKINAGVSPDSLIGNSGMLEVKTKLARLHLEVLDNNKLPPEHLAQCQGALLVAEREWIDFISYWPKLRPFITRVHRDEPVIATLKVEIARFHEEMAVLLEKLK